MKVTRFDEARPYDAANHRGSVSLRLQGFEPDGPANQWVGLSHYLPGGSAGPDSSTVEKIYVVVSGEIAVIVDGRETVLRRYDSCTIAPGETREVVNRSNDTSTMLVIIPYIPAAA
ncbi:cupin domain-containing protein [Sphingomonas sp.]|jgi:quercetin dioxygenase-like cupin family protein|uniref:cupin domain-containing protein n=1 Tax=Sphingomonas sp. TaxID=28214 RepID=UPI002ED8D1EF